MQGLGIVWSLLWRATLLAPLVFILFIIVFTTRVSRFVLPLLFAITCYAGDWTFAGVYAAAWTFSFFLWRSTRFREQFGEPFVRG